MDELYKAGKDITILISDLITHFRNVMVIGATNSETLVHTSQFEEYKNQAEKAGASRIIEIIKILNNTLSNIKYSMDKRVMIEMCLVELCTQVTDVELRLKELEDKLNSISIGNLDLNKFKDNRFQSNESKVVERAKEKPVDRAVANKVEKDEHEQVSNDTIKTTKKGEVSLSTQQLKSEWNQVISNLKNRNKMSTAVLLDKVRDMEVLNGTVVLYFDVVDEMFYKMSSRDENKTALIVLLKETYGDSIELKLEIKDLKNREQSIEKLKKNLSAKKILI